MILRFVLRALLGALVAGLLAVLAPVPRGPVLAGYLLFLGALLLIELLGVIARGLGGGTGSAFERALARRPGAAKRPDELTRLEDRVSLATGAAADVYVHLRPLLREAAAHRLRARHGVDLDRVHDRDRARSLLGDEAWELVRPDLQPPSDRFGPGIPPARLARVLDAVESL